MLNTKNKLKGYLVTDEVTGDNKQAGKIAVRSDRAHDPLRGFSRIVGAWRDPLISESHDFERRKTPLLFCTFFSKMKKDTASGLSAPDRGKKSIYAGRRLFSNFQPELKQ